MKKLIILGIVIVIAVVLIAAKWSDYTSLASGNIASGDTFLILDVSDTTLAATGTQKQYAWSAMSSDIEDLASLGKSTGDVWTGVHDYGGVTTFEIWNDTSDLTLGAAGQVGIQLTDDQLAFHGGSSGKIQGEAALSLLEHVVITFDPAWAYDQESTYRVLPIMYLGGDAVEGITIVEWRVNYVGGDPTTELDADIMCDTTPNFDPAADATVMDVIDTTAGAATADTGFDSATCANGSRMYIRFGADPTDANVLVSLDIWYYAEED